MTVRPPRQRVARSAAIAVLAIVLAAGLAVSCGGSDASSRPSAEAGMDEFDGAAALASVERQVAFGPRIPGTRAHVAAGDWLEEQMRQYADTVYTQEWTHVTTDSQRLPMRNIIARFKPEASRRVLYLAHWDSRPVADKDADPALREQGVPGANDGGSGVAILHGVAAALDSVPPDVGVDLVLLDGEDFGEFGPDTDVLIGSRWFAEHLPDSAYRPLFGVLFDMVGDADPRFEQESHSIRGAPEVVQRVWSTAQRLGYGAAFSNREYGPITDDHLPLLEKGLRVIDVIDLYYPWHHTTGDTPDKVSEGTLDMVGEVAIALIRDLQ